MTRLRIGIDLDGVVADFNGGWTWRYNRDFPDRVEAELTGADVVMWDAPVDLTHFQSMSQFWKWARTCAEGRSLFHGLEPYAGSVQALRRLRDQGHDLVILTTKPDFSIHDTYDWIARHRLPTTEVHILDDKTKVDCDIYLDDADHNLVALVAARPLSLVCRFVQPWNSSVPKAVDVDGWDEFEDLVIQHV